MSPISATKEPLPVSSASCVPADTSALPQNTDGPDTVSRGRLWTGRVLSGLVTLFLLFDAFGKLAKLASVVEASARIGFPVQLLPGIGLILLVSTVLYAIPRTAVLGAVLLTGYLGGAVEVMITIGGPVFEAVFPVLLGVVVWAGIYLREPRLLELFPLRCLGR